MEVIDAELWAILAYLRKMGDTTDSQARKRRCLVMSDCRICASDIRIHDVLKIQPGSRWLARQVSPTPRLCDLAKMAKVRPNGVGTELLQRLEGMQLQR